MKGLLRLCQSLAMLIALLVLLAEVPVREVARAWRNMRIRRATRDAFREWKTIWRAL